MNAGSTSGSLIQHYLIPFDYHISEDEEEQVEGMEDDQLSDEDVNIDEEDVDMIESARSFLASMKLGMPHVTGCDDDLFFCK